MQLFTRSFRSGRVCGAQSFRLKGDAAEHKYTDILSAQPVTVFVYASLITAFDLLLIDRNEQ